MIDESSVPQSDFFITLDKNSDLAKAASLFGKIVGSTIHNLVEAEEIPLGEDYRPKIGVSITGIDVVTNPFDNLVLQSKKKESDPVSSQPFQLPAFRKKQRFHLAEDDDYIQNFGRAPLVVANPDLKPKEEEVSLVKREQQINPQVSESSKRVKESSTEMSNSTLQQDKQVTSSNHKESLKKLEALKNEIKKLANPESSNNVIS